MEENPLYRFIHKILHINIGHLGEVILSTPLLQAIKDNWKDRVVHTLVLPRHKVIFDNSSLADKVLLFNDKWGLMDRFSFLKSLESENYDLVLVHTPTITGYIGSFLTKAPHRVGIVLNEKPLEYNVGKRLLTKPIIFDFKTWKRAGVEIPNDVEMSFRMAKVLGLKVKNRDLIFPLSKEDDRFAAKTFTKWRWERGRKIFCIHLSERWLTLGWDNIHFKRLVSELQKKYKGYVVFTYRSWQVDIGREIDRIYDKNPMVNCIWDMTIPQWAAIVKRCSYVIATDPSSVHLASSQKTPVVAIYPPDDFEVISKRWAPWRVKHKVLLHKAPIGLINDIMASIHHLEQIY